MLTSSSLAAQENGGVEATLSFSQGLSFSDDDAAQLRSNLGLGYSDTTRTQSFSAFIGTSFDGSLSSGIEADAIEPRFTVSYEAVARQSALSTNLSFRRSEVDDFFIDTNGALEVLVLDVGKRNDLSAGLNFQFGQEAPFGGSFDVSYRDIDYDGTTSDRLVDERTLSYGLDFAFKIDQSTTAVLGYNRSETDRASGRNSVSNGGTAGLQIDIAPTVSADLSLGRNRISVNDNGLRTVEEGLTLGSSITQTRPFGTIRYGLNSALSESGRRTSATLGTTYDTPRGELTGQVGLSIGIDRELRPILNLGYASELPRGNYSVAFDQSFASDVDGEDTFNSRLRLDWQQELTPTARLSSNLTIQTSDVLGLDRDTARLEFGVGYSQSLNEDWALTTRVTHTRLAQDNAATERNNELFLGLETFFGWRP